MVSEIFAMLSVYTGRLSQATGPLPQVREENDQMQFYDSFAELKSAVLNAQGLVVAVEVVSRVGGT